MTFKSGRLTPTNPLLHLCDGGFVGVTGQFAREYY